jgi:hypothetical protein
MDPYTMLKFRMWRKAVIRDRNWQMGEHYGKAEPTEGLMNAFREFYLDTFAPEFFEGRFGRGWADPAKNPAEDMTNLYAAYEWFDRKAVERAMAVDANSFIYMQRALELFSVAGKSTLEECVSLIKCPVLLIASKNDQLFTATHARRTRELLKHQGNWVEYFELDGALGHFNGFIGIKPASEVISKFLAGGESAHPSTQGPQLPTVTGYRKQIRDRFLAVGEAGMSDRDLLEVLLSYVVPQDDIEQVAAALVSRFVNLGEMMTTEVAALKHVVGHRDRVVILFKLIEAVAQRLAVEWTAEPSDLDPAPPVDTWSRLPMQSADSMAEMDT